MFDVLLKNLLRDILRGLRATQSVVPVGQGLAKGADDGDGLVGATVFSDRVLGVFGNEKRAFQIQNHRIGGTMGQNAQGTI